MAVTDQTTTREKALEQIVLMMAEIITLKQTVIEEFAEKIPDIPPDLVAAIHSSGELGDRVLGRMREVLGDE